MISSFAAGVGATYTCETGMKAAIMKSTEPTRRKVAATRSVLIEGLSSAFLRLLPVGGRTSPPYHATRRTSAHRCLFTGVRGIGILGTSPFGDSAKFAFTEFYEVRV